MSNYVNPMTCIRRAIRQLEDAYKLAHDAENNVKTEDLCIEAQKLITQAISSLRVDHRDRHSLDTFDINWLRENHVAAYEKLPECYQNDNRIDFWIENTYVNAKPKKSDEHVLGNWAAYFSNRDQAWFFDGLKDFSP